MATTVPHKPSPEELTRLKELFNQLDVNKDGVIDVNDLSCALLKMELHHVPGQAKSYFERYDHDKDGEINFHDFLNYYIQHEKELRLSFDRIDHNKDGYIDAEEIRQSFKNFGIDLSNAEATNLLIRMDKDKTLKISWSEWRDFHVLNPYLNDIHGVLHYWRHSTIIDMGEDSLVPDDFSEEELQTGVWWRHLVAGGIAGAVSRTSTAPLDRVKVMLQVHGTSQGTVGIVPWFHKMLQEGGTKSLWRGNGVNVIKIAPESALKFTSYEQIKRWIKGGDSRRELKAHERFVAGSLAGVLSQTLIYPLEVIKTRLVIRNTGQYKGILDCAQHLYKTEGIKCFYRGYVPNIMGIIPYAGCDLMIYETLKRWYTRNHCQSGDPPWFVMVTCAGISSTFGQIVAYPLALVRTRLQAQTNQVQNRNMVQIFTDILKKEGPRGLYRGMAANFIKVIPSVSISYTIYELSLKKFNVKMS